MDNWKDALAQRYAQIQKAKRGEMAESRRQGNSAPKEAARKFEVNLGIDFGTAYTKVCYRVVGRETVGIVRFSQTGYDGEKTLLPTILYLADEEILSPSPPIQGTATRELRFFKMHMAGMAFGDLRPPKFKGDVPFPDLLCSFFLANVIERAKQYVITEEKLEADRIVWSGNLGVPIGYLESASRIRFAEALAVAVSMCESSLTSASITMDALADLFASCLGKPGHMSRDFFLVSELEAAVMGITMDPSTPNGVYSVFDIGGGTIDGAAFEFERKDASPHVNFLTALVAPLGFDATCERIRESIAAETIAESLRRQDEVIEIPYADTEKCIQRHVASVIVLAKLKTPYSWKDRMHELPVLLCGGGRLSKFHRMAIESTYGCHSHGKAGIPPYECRDLSFPEMAGLKRHGASDLGRYLVAFGLSFPRGSYPEPKGFPRQNPLTEYRAQNEAIQILDERIYELYGELQ